MESSDMASEGRECAYMKFAEEEEEGGEGVVGCGCGCGGGFGGGGVVGG